MGFVDRQLDLSESSSDIFALYMYYRCVNITYYGYVMTAGFYLALRFLMKQQFHPEAHTKPGCIMPREDTLSASSRILHMLMNFTVPFIMAVMIICVKKPANFKIAPLLYSLFWFQLITSFISVVFIYAIVFVDYKKGSDLWVARSPKIFLDGTLCIFVVFPIVNILF